MAKQIKVSVVGASGRMGSAILHEIKGSPKKFQPYLAISRSKPIDGFIHSSPNPDVTLLGQSDVCIDFSTLESMPSICKAAEKSGIPLVCGVTGLETKHFKLLEQTAKKIPVLWSPNMSPGINMFLVLIEQLKVLKNWDFQITEVHHNKKVDSPSGTAKLLQQKAESTLGKKLPPIAAIRGGGVYGEHSLLAMADSETITIEHKALNRQVFAQGSLMAASWILDKSAGLYSMQDVLRSKK